MHCFSGHSLVYKPYAMPLTMPMVCRSCRTNQTLQFLCKDHNLLQHHSGEAESVKIQRTCNEGALKRSRLESFHCENHSTGTVGRHFPKSTVTPLWVKIQRICDGRVIQIPRLERFIMKTQYGHCWTSLSKIYCDTPLGRQNV